MSCANAPGADASLDADDAGDVSRDASAALPEPACKAGEWCSLKLSTMPVSLNGIWGAGPDDVWIVGSPDTAIHWDGAVFTTLSIEQYQPLLGIWGSGRNDIWAFGTTQATWHYAADSDAGWSRSLDDPDTNAAAAVPISSIWGASATDVWAVGGAAAYKLASVFHCDGWRDGAPNWQPSPTSSDDPPKDEYIHFNAISGSVQSGIWVVGNGGKTRYTTGWSDGHATWTPVNSHTQRTLYAVWASPNGDVWAGGEGGVLHRFSRGDGGEYQETTVETAATKTIRAIWGLADDDVWAVGGEGTVLHWDGAAWTLLADPIFEAQDDLFAIWGSSKDDLWIAGRGALLHKGSVVLPGVVR